MADLKANQIPSGAWGLKRLADKDPKAFEAFVKAYSERVERDSVESDEERKQLMKSANPRYVLRNWMAQAAIEKAEAGDFEEVRKLLRVLKRPFEEQVEAEEAGYSQPSPPWAKELKVSCSS